VQIGTPPPPGARGVTYTLGPDGRIIATPTNPDGRGRGVTPAGPAGSPPAGRGPVNVPPPGR
jgi:hypothetical protein